MKTESAPAPQATTAGRGRQRGGGSHGETGEVAGVTLLVALLIDASSVLGARDSGLGLVFRCSGAQVLTCSIGSAASFCRPLRHSSRILREISWQFALASAVFAACLRL